MTYKGWYAIKPNQPICPPKIIKDKLKNLYPKKLDPIKQKSSHWPLKKNSYWHQSEQWKTKKQIQTILSQTW